MFICTLNLTALQTAEDLYLAPPLTCRLIKADTALYTAITSADAVLTFSDGTTDIGTTTITQSGCGEGDVDHIVLETTTPFGKVELGPDTPLKIELDGGPDAGAAMLTLTFDEYHAGL